MQLIIKSKTMTTKNTISFKDISTTLISQTNPVDGLAVAIIEQCGGKAAFDIVTDVLSLGIVLDEITGFKEASDTLGLFSAHKDVFVACVESMANEQGLTQDKYLIQITDGRNILKAKKAYEVIRKPEMLDSCTPIVAAEHYELSHLIVIHVVSKILLDVNQRLKGLPF